MTAILNTTKLTEIFIFCADFLQKFTTYQLDNGYQADTPTQLMSESERMAISSSTTTRASSASSTSMSGPSKAR